MRAVTRCEGRWGDGCPSGGQARLYAVASGVALKRTRLSWRSARLTGSWARWTPATGAVRAAAAAVGRAQECGLEARLRPPGAVAAETRQGCCRRCPGRGDLDADRGNLVEVAATDRGNCGKALGRLPESAARGKDRRPARQSAAATAAGTRGNCGKGRRQLGSEAPEAGQRRFGGRIPRRRLGIPGSGARARDHRGVDPSPR